MKSAFDRLCAHAGIIWRYKDGAGVARTAPSQTRRAMLAAMGFEAGNKALAEAQLRELREIGSKRVLPPWHVADSAKPLRLGIRDCCEWQLVLESGEARRGTAIDAIDLGVLPAGYHSLSVGEEQTLLLCAPARLPLPPRGWGITAPLYGLKPGGIGDYGDLAEAARVIGGHGAAFIGINPVHAGFPENPEAFSPYSPSSRRRFSTAHIAAGLPATADFGLIGYSKSLAEQKAALRRDFEADSNPALLDDFLRAEGAALHDFAVHQAISERYGAYWNTWPETFRNPRTPDVVRFANENPGEIRFHCWAQMTAERQLRQVADAARSAGMNLGLYLDLAVGTHPYGAETWADRALFAEGISLGAPPDAFSSSGQVWGLAPIIPQRLAERGFAPLAETLRKQLAFAGLLRIDHILGFDRAYWAPDGLPGAYVKMPRQAMLAVARIEASRAGAVIIGEDLGNVPRGLRTSLARSGILGCRVSMFERNWRGDRSFIAPQDYEPRTIASFNTHDLPTWVGWRKGTDICWNRKLNRMSEADASAALAERRKDAAEFEHGAGGGSFEDLCRFLGRAGSRLVALQIEDILGLEDQPNLPGTVAEHPNWRRRLPVKVADLADEPHLVAAAGLMSNANR